MKENVYTFDTILRKAVSEYNTAVKRLCKNYSKANEEKAYKMCYYLRGVKDTIEKATGCNVILEYVDSSYFSEISMFLITIK